ncbi:hypothetical protein L1049_005636 [Liquidambar formosana]|uniref:Magnesium transporter n=1 Tax=Liquidambar formosana TaxID=63359 RepID=A0AAP0RE37_LIQFO
MAPLLSPSSSDHAPRKDDAVPTQPTTDVDVDNSTVLRKKATGVRRWLLLDYTGHARVVEAGKYAIMRRTGLPARDLRVLEPFLSYPSRVMGRERAMVINLEQIKAIITAQEVLLLNSKDPSVVPFVEELHRRILRFHRPTKAQDFQQLKEMEEEGKVDGKQAPEHRKGILKALPFEFVVLEACLEAACGCLDNEATILEQEAHPALDRLTSRVTTLNLERVRQIKSRLVAITGRVEKVRDEIEHLLDDDGDMAEMYLTAKMAQRHHETSSVCSDGMDGYEDTIENTDNPQELSFGATLNTISKDSRGTHPSKRHINDVQELEMLLEAYFVQIDGILNKLSTLKEYVDDTEDYINIMLDDKQNQLLRMGITLSTTNVVLLLFIVVAGVMGINIKIPLWNEDIGRGTPKFLWSAGGGTAATIAVFILVIALYKQKHLL